MKKLMIAGTVALLAACDPPKDAAFVFDEVTYSPTETVFKIFAPETPNSTGRSSGVFVVVDGDSIPMVWKPTVDDVRCIYKAVVPGDLKGKTYEFVVDGQSSPGVFAKAVTVNGQKGVVVDLRDSDPEGWNEDSLRAADKEVRKAWPDMVVYEMHHRDFSVGRSDARYPGKFLALTEPWAINHLKSLGITAVHILPSYDYGSVDETRLGDAQYNWGYDPVNYNVPEGGYSTDPYDPLCRIREFKQMVQALHKEGIAVILDVVYNHTYDIEHSNFQRTYPDYYYRKTEDGQYSNGSGCGNETASEQPMMRRFMIESVKYWINEYHIDGFRFDLMGCHDIETMNEIRKAVDEIDPRIFIYGEGWSAGACALPNEQLGMKANISRMPGIAAFSDELRDALRGPFSDDTKPGWLGQTTTQIDDKTTTKTTQTTAASEKESLKFGIVGAIEHPQVNQSLVNYAKEPWASEPTQMMAYVSCHDDMCLVDRLKASIPNISEEELIRLDLLAQTAVFTSQGVPFMLSGEELLRTKQGVHNSFESPDSINQLDWSNKERYPQVFAYYKGLIALRRHHPAFRLGSADLVRRHLSFLDTTDGVVAFQLSGHAGGDPWQDIIVILNASRQAQRVPLPDGSGSDSGTAAAQRTASNGSGTAAAQRTDSYTVVCCDGQIDEEGLGEVHGPEVLVLPQSALIIYK